MEELRIAGSARYHQGSFAVNGAVRSTAAGDREACISAAWAAMGATYDRFHRVDAVSKLVLLCTEALLAPLPIDEDLTERTGIVLMSRLGSLDTDLRYHSGLVEQNLASPALFVYTLPNIAMGELSIRHGLHGAGHCLIAAGPDTDRLRQVCTMLLAEEGMHRVICGWADIFADEASATFMLVGSEGRPWDQDEVNQLYR